jgi:hypothetical protein
MSLSRFFIPPMCPQRSLAAVRGGALQRVR